MATYSAAFGKSYQLTLNTLKNISAVTADAFWEHFYETTGNNHPQADQQRVKVLHKLAAENVAAIEALKEVDFAKPLDMAFMAINATKVDLSNMRGKVVLIDF